MDDELVPVDASRVREALIESIEVGVLSTIPAYAHRTTVGVQVDASTRRIEAVVTTWLMAGKSHIHLGQDYFPATFWDHAKSSMPRWLQRLLRPARFTKVTKSINITRVCPHIIEGDRSFHLRYVIGDA